MSFLTAAQSAAMQLIGKVPPTFFSSTNQFEQEICFLANELVADLVREKDWRKLTKLKTMNGDGITVGFDQPSDFDHFPKGQQVHNATWLTWRYIPATSLDEWLDYINGRPLPSPGAWIWLDGQMQFSPPVDAQTVAQYYYISKNIVRAVGGQDKPQFTADDDTLVYNERLITLGLIWRWQAMKRLEYSESLSNFERLKDSVAGDDKGSTILTVGSRTGWPRDIQSAYPWPLGQ